MLLNIMISMVKLLLASKIKFAYLLIIGAYFMLTQPTLIQQSAVELSTKLGPVNGLRYTTSKGNIGERYLGLPYAEKRTPSNRFEYAVGLDKWPEQPYNATYQRPGCIHYWILKDTVEGEEDCLYLNIFKPVNASRTTKHPVLFWIHGGSYIAGSGNQFDLDGVIDNFASKGIVVVTINYRLDALGFLSLSNGELPGNYGLEDQLLALKWVNENIDDFGGDRKSITLCGESAGGGSVSLLALSPKAQDMFQKLIMISGSANAPWSVADKSEATSTRELLNWLKCPTNEHAPQCLKKLNVRQLLIDSVLEVYTRKAPVVDSYRKDAIVPKNPKDMTRELKSRVPVLMGVTTGELPVPSEHLGWKDAFLFNQMKDEAFDLIEKMYNNWMPNNNSSERLREAYSDYMVRVPMHIMAESLNEQGSLVYFYLYDLRDRKTNIQPYHGADVAYLFNNRSLILNDPPKEDMPKPSKDIDSTIFDSFRNFIKTGNPNKPKPLPEDWPEYKANGVSNVVKITNEKFEVLKNYFEAKTKFWKSVEPLFAQY